MNKFGGMGVCGCFTAEGVAGLRWPIYRGVSFTIYRGQTVITVKVSVITGEVVIPGNLSSGPALEGENITEAHIVPEKDATSANPKQG